VRASDADVVLVLQCTTDDGVHGAFQPFEEQLPRVAHLERECGVDHIRGREPVVEPASRRPEVFRDRVDEGGEVVVGLALDLGHALRPRRPCGGADLGDRVERNRAQLAPGLERCELDLQPSREAALVRPDAGHRRSGVTRDHCAQSRARAGGPL
jgi:hypothetical protein